MPDLQMPALPELRHAFVTNLDTIEWRDSRNGTDFTLTGHAAVFSRWSEELDTWAGSFREQIAPGAFSDVLERGPDVRLLMNHDSNLVMARTTARTLELTEDDQGLRVWARVAPTSYAKDLRLSMNRGDVNQMSFAFTVAEDEWHEDKDAEEIARTILRVGDLYDVSVVTYPAYPDTDAAIRSLRAAADAGLIRVAAPARVAGTGNTTASTNERTAGASPAPPDGAAETNPPTVGRLKQRTRARIAVANAKARSH